MIIMTDELSQEEKRVFLPSEAIKYLREERGIDITVVGLRQRRNRGTAKADHVATRNTLWTKEELDAIKPSARTKRVPMNDEDNH